MLAAASQEENVQFILAYCLTAFLAGVRSIWWIAWPSQVVVGLLLTYMNFVALRNTSFQSKLGVLVGLSPLVFFVTCFGGGGLLYKAGATSVEGPTWMGWSLVIYGLLIFLPAYRLFELVAPGTPPIQNSVGSWISVSYLALVVALGAILPLVTSEGKGGSEDLKARIAKTVAVLAGAENLWDDGEKAAAIKEYKAFLKSEERIHVDSRERYSAYRRVIEYEADHGDASEARDWALRAFDACAGEPERLSFQSTKARAIWSEIVSEWEKRRDSGRGKKVPSGEPGSLDEAFRESLFQAGINAKNYKVFPFKNGWAIVLRTTSLPTPGSKDEQQFHQQFFSMASHQIMQGPGISGQLPNRLTKLVLAVDGREYNNEYLYIYWMPNK